MSVVLGSTQPNVACKYNWNKRNKMLPQVRFPSQFELSYDPQV